MREYNASVWIQEEKRREDMQLFSYTTPPSIRNGSLSYCTAL